MPHLEVPGAALYHELHGTGAPLLLIPGGRGSAEVFRLILPHLTAARRVILLDRRGFARSTLHGPQQGDKLDRDVDDVRRLVAALGHGPVDIFGTSSGAVVALRLLLAHPDAVARMIVHEPAAFELLPDAARWRAFFDRLHALYRSAGLADAYALFRDEVLAEVDHAPITASLNLDDPAIVANSTFWFEEELRQYTTARLDIDRLGGQGDRLVASGGDASPGFPTYEAARVLAAALGRPLLSLPGGHLGYATHPAPFAAGLLQALGEMPPGALGSA